MLWVGLGNPGRSYAGNRHNVGFMALDRIVRDYSFSDWKVDTSSAVSEGRIGTVKIRALKPLSFMNKSGLPVANVARYYNCLLYTSPSPRDRQKSRMPSSA